MTDAKDTTSEKTTEATESKPTVKQTKKVVAKKQRYFVPSVGMVEAGSLKEVAAIVKKQESKGQ